MNKFLKYFGIISLLVIIISATTYTSLTSIVLTDENGNLALVNNGALDVNISDQTSRAVNLYMTQELSVCTLDSITGKNAPVIKVTTDGTVPIAGNFIELYEGNFWNQTEIESVVLVAGNQYRLTLGVLMDLDFTVGATCMLTNADMDIDGSSTPIEFTISPQYLDSGEQWHLNRMMISMIIATAGDMGLFGDITALTNGQDFKIINGVTFNDMHIKDNSDFALQGYDVSFDTRSGGGGSFGMRSRITFNGQGKKGVAIELKSTEDDRYSTFVNDNLTGINKYRIIIQGHMVD